MALEERNTIKDAYTRLNYMVPVYEKDRTAYHKSNRSGYSLPEEKCFLIPDHFIRHPLKTDRSKAVLSVRLNVCFMFHISVPIIHYTCHITEAEGEVGIP